MWGDFFFFDKILFERKTISQKRNHFFSFRGTMSGLFEMIEEYLMIQKRRNELLKIWYLLTGIYRGGKLSKA